jgi:hypothetical protein
MPFMKSHSRKRKRDITPNGDIPSSSRLSMALPWFAGGDPADIEEFRSGGCSVFGKGLLKYQFNSE